MHGVEFSSSKSSAETLSDLQPLLSNVEIQELLREALSACPVCALRGF